MDWRGFAKRLILHDGTVGPVETALLQKAMLADQVIDPDELVFLLELKESCREPHPDFLELIKRVLALRVLRDGKIDEEEVRWLRKRIFEDQVVSVDELDLLVQLEAQAKLVCPEYYKLLDEAKDFLRSTLRKPRS